MQNEISLIQFPPLSLKFIKAYLITMRPYLLFVSGIAGIVGLAYTTPLSFLSTTLVMTASFLSYGFGQALTDCFQTDTDSISSPYRPLTQGVVSKNHFLVVSISGLIFCIAVFVMHNPINLILGTAAGLGLATYTYFKRKFWAGPFYNAWIVAVLSTMAFMSGEVKINSVVNSEFIFVVLSVFFGYANFVLSGYFKDIEADRATGYNTLPVKFGRKVSAYVSDVFALLMILLGALVLIDKVNHIGFNQTLIPGIALLVVSIVLICIGQFILHQVKTDAEAHSSIALVVHSYILMLSGLTLLQRPEWLLFILLFYVSFNVVMYFRPEKNQI